MVKAQGSCTAKGGKAKKSQTGKEKGAGVKKSREKKKNVLEKKKKSKVSKKKILKVGDREALDCCVLLTRLDDRGTMKVKDAPKTKKHRSAKTKTHCGVTKPGTKSDLKKTPRANQKALEPKIDQSDSALAVLPRRRRMASLNAEAVNTLLLYHSHTAAKKPHNDNLNEHKGPKTKKTVPKEGTDKKDVRPKKRSKKSQVEEIDWLTLLAPTPRRQAGLTAATLLKLTSSQYTNKRQKKKDVKVEGDGETAAKEDKMVDKTTTKNVAQLKHRKQKKRDVPNKPDPAPQGCSLCTGESVGPEWRGECLGGPPLQHGPALGYPLKVKEEQMENQVSSSCYCCTQERCVQYCHRLALFLRDKSFKEQDASLFHHHHHHHHHLPNLGTHSYTCFPGYYVHFGHPPSSEQDCPKGGGKRAKLLGARSTGPPGISHPVYCCTAVEPCYDPCTISGYQAYTSVIPAISHSDCNKCNHAVKKEEQPCSPLPICPAPRVLTTCPVPPVPPASQSVPHLQTPPSETSQPAAAPLRVGQDCPQRTKPIRSDTRGSGAIIRDKKHTPSAPSGGRSVPKQLKKWRHKSTNGWRPVGVSYQREVFCVGEESPVLRTCFEGVQRDSDLIRVRDTVLLKSGPRRKSLPYVAKVSALWEDPETGELMMSLFWYYRPEHTQGGRNPNIHCENEVFASRHQDVNSVACIEDKCYVLTLAQYCRFCALVKRQREGHSTTSAAVVPPVLEHALPTHHCVPPDLDPTLVFFCRHVYDFRYGRLLKNLQ